MGRAGEILPGLANFSKKHETEDMMFKAYRMIPDQDDV